MADSAADDATSCSTAAGQSIPAAGELWDQFGRRITYLRLSLTEHCNFRCQYCSPASGTPFFDYADHLRAEEIELVLRSFHALGLQHLRFTGGEPLIHPQLLRYVQFARELQIGKLSLSTNGYLLDRLAEPLAAAGLNSINISLDTLDAETFARVTRGGRLQRVLQGIDCARAAGIPRIKLNVVLLRRVNAHSLPELVEYALARHLDIRFIETMPLGSAGIASQDTEFFSAQAARASIEAKVGKLIPVASSRDQGPARLYTLAGAGSRIGFITPLSNNFCASCNRVRLTATGRLVYCLGQEAGLELRPLLRGGASVEELSAAITAGVWRDKPERHLFTVDRGRSSKIFMMRLGG
ncbi:GTP 3',8-cyclase MoaA [Candidatus Igneacidithiobacillus taiwanensis]|uniref:GTP 3',8-cyclase MoaA n=1 Tax=Candidatus Igneacidithiobacillus taiwanensis TaxID=1945924 RepID=UPI00289BD504|nr:GTP 3',8-cyclase MoaA [Candidatus Igneacidithiobacillus taiwanensis]MCE5360987.1 GTP 3',8-cyclase MoaA [Acidithiobacillus sp.]